MKVKYIGKSQGISLTENKIYEALGYEHGFVRVVDDTDEDYLYEPSSFIPADREAEQLFVDESIKK
jgi:hypothetical protein